MSKAKSWDDIQGERQQLLVNLGLEGLADRLSQSDAERLVNLCMDTGLSAPALHRVILVLGMIAVYRLTPEQKIIISAAVGRDLLSSEAADALPFLAGRDLIAAREGDATMVSEDKELFAEQTTEQLWDELYKRSAEIEARRKLIGQGGLTITQVDSTARIIQSRVAWCHQLAAELRARGETVDWWDE